MRALLVLALLAAPAEADDRLRDRTTLTTGFGLLAMQVEGVTTSGMHVQPAVTRTFDRAELHAEYLLGDLRGDAAMPGATVHRLGLAARYQFHRVRDRRGATLDFVVEGGAGMQYLVLEDGRAFGRSDIALGVGLRALAALPVRQRERVLMSMELMLRVLVMPSDDDKALVFAFGFAFGR